MEIDIDLGKVYQALREHYQRNSPELLPLLAIRYEYATGLYPPLMKLANRIWLLEKYYTLKGGAKIHG